MATENLKVKITADASQAKAEIGKFKKSLQGVTSEGNESAQSMKNLKATLRDFKAGIKGDVSAIASLPATLAKIAVAVAGVVAAVKVLKGLVSNAINVGAMGDEIKDNAQKVFMSTTAYQEWGYVLKQNGIEISALKVGMRQFAQSVANGDDALKKYGITATNVDEAFEQAIYHIQNLSTETEKVAAATELFGTRALELFPILNLTNEETQSLMQTYRMIGGTMSNELIAMSDACTDSITAMKAAWGGLRNLLAQYFLPVITKIVQWLTVLIAKVRIVLAAIFGIKETFGGSSKKNSVAGASASTAKSTGGTAKNLKKAAKSAKELRRTLMGIDELSRLAEKATSSAGAGGSSGLGSVGGGISSDDIGDLGSLGGLLDDDTLRKLATFQDKVNSIKGILNGLYEILRGIGQISLGKWAEGWESIRSGADKVWKNLKENFPILQTLEDKWTNLKTWFNEEVKPKISINIPRWEDIKKKWNDLKANFTGKDASIGISLPTWNSLKKSWNNLLANFKGKTAEISLKFSAAASDLKKWINNNVIAKVNAKFKQVPILKNHLIPYLARGGVLTSPTAAIMGEYAGARSNPEIATPQSLMYETIQKANGDLIGAFAVMTRQIIATIEQKDLSVNIGDEQVARSAQRGNSAYYNRTGKALLTI